MQHICGSFTKNVLYKFTVIIITVIKLYMESAFWQQYKTCPVEIDRTIS